MKRILLIDDSLIQLRTLNMLLQGKYEVLMSTTGYDGISIAKRERPDLILLDYNMPILSGRDAFKKLQEKEETRDIPVIFLTGVDEREEVEEVLKLRPQGYLLKPVENDLLFKKIDKILAAQEAKLASASVSEEEAEDKSEGKSEDKSEDEFGLGSGLNFKTGGE